MRVLATVVCLIALAAWLSTPAFGDEGMVVACNPDKPAVYLGETVVLRAWAATEPPEKLSYDWEASVGKLAGAGREVMWDLSGLEAGTYEATVHVARPSGETEKCSLKVLAQKGGRKGDATGWSLLISGRKEKPGYGLYSYILFGSRPTDLNRERYLKALAAYVSLVESIIDLQEAGMQPHQLNITYLPVTKMPPQTRKRPSPEWLLSNYDFALARKILSAMPGGYRSQGPYIISHAAPLSNVSQFPDWCLEQDLSAVMPRVVFGYAQAFFNQAAQVRYWEENTTKTLALRLQNTLYITANAMSDVPVAMKKVRSMISLVDNRKVGGRSGKEGS